MCLLQNVWFKECMGQLSMDIQRFSSLDDLHASTLGSMVTNKGNRLGEVSPGIPVTPTTAGRTRTVNTPASLSVSTECQMAKIRTCVWKPEGYSTGVGDDSESYRGRPRLVLKKMIETRTKRAREQRVEEDEHCVFSSWTNTTGGAVRGLEGHYYYKIKGYLKTENVTFPKCSCEILHINIFFFPFELLRPKIYISSINYTCWVYNPLVARYSLL